MTSNSTICKDKLNSRNMVSLLVTHTKLSSTSGPSHTSCPPVRAVALQCLCVSVSNQSDHQVIQHCCSSLVPAPATAHGHALRTLRHRICWSPLLPLSPHCCNSWGEGEKEGKELSDTCNLSSLSLAGIKAPKWTCFSTRVGQTQTSSHQAHDREAAVVNSFVPGAKRKEETFDTQQTKAKHTTRGCWTISVHNENSWLG